MDRWAIVTTDKHVKWRASISLRVLIKRNDTDTVFVSSLSDKCEPNGETKRREKSADRPNGKLIRIETFFQFFDRRKKFCARFETQHAQSDCLSATSTNTKMFSINLWFLLFSSAFVSLVHAAIAFISTLEKETEWKRMCEKMRNLLDKSNHTHHILNRHIEHMGCCCCCGMVWTCNRLSSEGLPNFRIFAFSTEEAEMHVACIYGLH